MLLIGPGCPITDFGHDKKNMDRHYVISGYMIQEKLNCYFFENKRMKRGEGQNPIKKGEFLKLASGFS